LSKTILLVDDEPHVLEVLRVTLEDLGFRLLEAQDGPSAISLAKSESPDLVVLDVMLPSMSGLDVCRALKESTDTVGTPVIMLTARSGEDDAQAGYEAGADRYLTKPFSPLTLLTEVVKLLNMELA
jgi:two-component system, OmpR family, alkaline phosphatase synthesis response regulator PhoP